jgi:hypothetical protein
MRATVPASLGGADEIRQSVFGNAGNFIAFRVSQSDARILEDEFGGETAAALAA